MTNTMISQNRLRITFQSLYVALVIIFCVTPKELTIYSFTDNITRQFGSTISISIPMLLTFIIIFLGGRSIRIVLNTMRTPIFRFWIYGIVSIIFFPFTSVELPFYLVTAFKFTMYMLIYITMTNRVRKIDFEVGIDLGFKISLLIQSTAGWLYMLTGKLLPFFGNYSASVRNGIPRMVGSFTHPGDFSLYIAVIFVYFASKIFYDKKKSDIMFLFIGAMDIYFSGARTMLIVSAFIFFVIIMKRYSNNTITKLGAVLIAVIGIQLFVQSDIFQDLFIKHDFYDMFTARFVHWMLGFKIFFENIFTFSFGVGANSHVAYINANFNKFSGLILSASSVLNSDFARGMPIHNSFLIIACEFGVLGLGLYLSIYLSSAEVAIRNLKQGTQVNYHYIFVISALTTFAIYSVQGWAIMKNFAWILVIIILSTLYHQSNAE